MIFRIAYAVVWPLFHLFFPFEVVNRQYLPQCDTGYVLCCNHISLLDPLYIVFAFKRKTRIYFMAKQELFRNRLFAGFLRGCGAFPVSRGAGATSGVKTAETVLANKQILGIFPEGTRSRTGELGKAKSGAAMLVTQFDTFVQPVTLVCKHQKVRPFRKMQIIIGEPVHMPPCDETMSKREHLRVCTKKIMQPIEEALAHYGK